jgi:hypothetical protein
MSGRRPVCVVALVHPASNDVQGDGPIVPLGHARYTINFNGTHAAAVGELVVRNAECWIREFHPRRFADRRNAGDPRREPLIDRDAKYSGDWRQFIEEQGVEVIRLPPKSPNLNAYAERFVRSIKYECIVGGGRQPLPIPNARPNEPCGLRRRHQVDASVHLLKREASAVAVRTRLDYPKPVPRVSGLTRQPSSMCPTTRRALPFTLRTRPSITRVNCQFDRWSGTGTPCAGPSLSMQGLRLIYAFNYEKRFDDNADHQGSVPE